MSNYAFIDSQNLNLSIQSLGWNLDWARFRVYLKEKYGVEVAYLFLGYIEANTDMYTSLQKAGYVLIFKPTFENRDGEVKGNCDAELVLQAMIDKDQYERAVIVSGDGDFASLVNYMYSQSKLEAVIVPNQYKYSALLKKAAREKIYYLNNLRKRLEYTRNRKPAEKHEPEVA